MNRYHYFALPAYLVALSLILIPAFDAAMTLWPWQMGSAQWRFGAVGLGSNALMIPLAGLLVAFATALALGDYRVLRVLGVICAVLAFLTGVSIVLFALDALQTRANVSQVAQLSFKVASLTAAAKLLLATITLAAFAIAGRRSTRERNVPAGQQLRAPLTSTSPTH